MCAFVDDLLLDSGESVKDDCASATFDIVDRLLRCENTEPSNSGESVEILKSTLRHRNF